jgi:type IV pilus assembly protein PilM
MASWLNPRRHGPIGVDLGTRSVKLMQFSADGSRLLASGRWDLPYAEKLAAPQRDAQWVEGIRRARESESFRGRDAVFCLSAPEIFVQNIRVPLARGQALDQIVRQEAAGRLPFEGAETEIRFVEAGDVRQGDAVKREVIVLATPKAALQRALAVIERADLRPLAVDAEPMAVVRCFTRQFRREEDRNLAAMYVHIGASNTSVVIARGGDTLFVKYLDLGGRHFDEAVARGLNMKLADAASLRRHHGERRSDRHDPEVERTVGEAVLPVIDRLAGEVTLCLRYFSVTFRGQKLERFFLSGGEACETLVEAIQRQLNVPGELGDPLRGYERATVAGRKSQWDVAAGLALRKVE